MAEPLRAGNWFIDANGFEGVLTVRTDDAGNILPGSTVFGDPIIGFFNRVQEQIIFLRQSAPEGPSNVQVYTGVRGPGPDRLSGQFVAFRGTGGSPEKWLFNWRAEFRDG
jgi:hypothetical protein